MGAVLLHSRVMLARRARYSDTIWPMSKPPASRSAAWVSAAVFSGAFSFFPRDFLASCFGVWADAMSTMMKLSI